MPMNLIKRREPNKVSKMSFERVYEYRQAVYDLLNARKIKDRYNGSFPDYHLRKPYPDIGKRGNEY